MSILPLGWSVVEVKRNGVLAGIFAVKDNEIHCERIEAFKGRWLTRQDLERLTAPIFKQYGVLRTKVRETNETGHAFVKRLGFEEVGRTDGLRHYEATRLKHARL